MTREGDEYQVSSATRRALSIFEVLEKRRGEFSNVLITTKHVAHQLIKHGRASPERNKREGGRTKRRSAICLPFPSGPLGPVNRVLLLRFSNCKSSVERCPGDLVRSRRADFSNRVKTISFLPR